MSGLGESIRVVDHIGSRGRGNCCVISTVGRTVGINIGVSFCCSRLGNGGGRILEGSIGLCAIDPFSLV